MVKFFNMRKRIILILLMPSTLVCCGLNIHKDNELNVLDYSSVWTCYQNDVLGYVGENYQRFYFLIDSIKANSKETLQYKVWGRYRIKDAINYYVGSIRIAEGFEKLPEKYSIVEDNPLSGIQVYSMVSEWNLNAIGVKESIKGKMTSTFYIHQGKVFFDDLDIECSDSYRNNQFIGTLQSASGKENKCRWGTFRIPDSEEFDIGAADFFPDDKYIKNGWQSYSNAYLEGTKKGWEIENQSHWTLRPDTLQLKTPAIINDPDGYVNIREKSNVKSKVVRQIKENELFYFTPLPNTEWYPVYLDENEPSIGYIHQSRIKTFEDFSKWLQEKVRKKRDGGY